MPDNNWTLISGSTPQDYTDTAVFEVNPDTKQIALITGQALVAGEKDSQYISFLMPRYWDGIDISDKSFTVEYALAGTYYGTSEAVNAEMTTEQVRFGWIVPETACAISGTLLFVLKITSEDYILKTQIVEHPVFKTINVEDVVPEPTKEAWYIEFQNRVDGAISEAEAAVDTAQATLTQVEASVGLAQTAAQEAQTAEGNAEAAAAIAQIRYGSPLVAQIADEMVEQNRVYVYTGSETGYTAGHWYYYDGTTWVSGGVYNGTGINTDTTLTQAGMAADAKATGDEISQIKEDLLDLEQEGYPMASIQEAVNAWADEHETEVVNNYVTPQMYGAVGDGISDDTTALQSTINSGKPIFIPDGTYVVSQPLICQSVCMMELSKNATIKAKTGTTLSCLLGLRNDGNAYSLAENEYICGGIFDGNGCCDAVIGINYTRGKIENCIIQGVKHYGIHIGHNLQSEGVGSGSLRVIDVIVQNTNASLGTIGIYSNRTDNYIRAITKNMETGFSVLSGETLDGCHAWIAYASMFTNSVAYILRGTQDILTACTSDTMRYGIKIQSGSGRINVSDFSYYHNTNVATPTVLEDTPCVVFDFYSRTHIFLATNILVNLAGSQGKIISDSAIGSDLIRFVNLGISQGENAVTANIPKDVSALNPAKIPLSETSSTNLTQTMIDAIDTNKIIGGYSAISGLEGWSIVITTVNADVRVQTLIRAEHGAVVRRYSNGTWNSFS